MRSRILALFLLVGLSSNAQYRRRATGYPPTPTDLGAHKGLIVTVHGALKKMSKKEMLIQTNDSQLMTIRISKKSTKFMDGDKVIKPYVIDLETPVTVDVTQDTDLKFIAVTVFEDAKKPPAPTPASTK